MMKSKKEALEIARLYNRWIEESRLVKSPRTVDSYELTINLYIRFLITSKGVNIKSFSSKDCFSRSMIEDWLRWLQDNNKCTGYIYLNDDPIGFAYGNLSDIIDPNLYGNLVKEIYGSEEDGVVYYKLVF